MASMELANWGGLMGKERILSEWCYFCVCAASDI